MEKPLWVTGMETSGHGRVDYLVPACSERKLIEGDCKGGSRDGTHPEDPLLVPVAGHQRCSKGARRVDAAQNGQQQQCISSGNKSSAFNVCCMQRQQTLTHLLFLKAALATNGNAAL